MKVHPIWQFAAVATASSVACGRLGWVPLQCGSELSSLVATLAQIGTTMLGFMLAALAVLASINHTHLVEQMHKTGHYKDLLSTLFTGCLAFLLCGLLSMVVLFGYEPGHSFRAALVGIHIASLWSLIDVGRKFWMVLSNLRPGTS